ncbi:MAG: hypothetical protein IPH74_14035 [Bacteroidetes bacterium]|nr:hypothetical protein [Bacteroidota bacterium]
MLGCNIYRMGGISTNFNTDGVGLIYRFNTFPAFMVAGDFDGDGKDDIITTDRRRLVSLALYSIFNVYIIKL